MAVNVVPKNLATLSPTLLSLAINQLSPSIILFTPQTAVCTIVENTLLNVLPKPLDAADAVANTPTKVIMTDINIPTGFAFITTFNTR